MMTEAMIREYDRWVETHRVLVKLGADPEQARVAMARLSAALPSTDRALRLLKEGLAAGNSIEDVVSRHCPEETKR